MKRKREEEKKLGLKKKKRNCAGGGGGVILLIKSTAQIQHYWHWIELNVEPPKVRHVNRIRHPFYLICSLPFSYAASSLFGLVDNPKPNTCT